MGIKTVIVYRAALGTGFLFLMTTLGAAVVFCMPGQSNALLRRGMPGFAGGIMTAASIWSLLLPAIAQAEHTYAYPAWLPAAGGLVIGAVFLAVLDTILYRLREWNTSSLRDGNASGRNSSLRDGNAPGQNSSLRDGNAPGQNSSLRGQNTSNSRDALFITAITLHNIPEGMAVGLACALTVYNAGTALADAAGTVWTTQGMAAQGTVGTFAGAAALALGIGIQNFPEGAAVSLPRHQSGATRLSAFRDGMLSGIVEPLFGIPAALCGVYVRPLMPWLLSFAAGAMLYVVQDELSQQARGHIGTAAYLCGFVLMMILDIAFG